MGGASFPGLSAGAAATGAATSPMGSGMLSGAFPEAPKLGVVDQVGNAFLDMKADAAARQKAMTPMQKGAQQSFDALAQYQQPQAQFSPVQFGSMAPGSLAQFIDQLKKGQG